MTLFALSSLQINAQDLRHYVDTYADSVNHSSLYFPAKFLMISDYKAESDRSVKSWVRDKFLNENFLSVKENNYTLTLDPLFDNYLGQDLNSSKNLYGNTRGIRAQGVFYFNTDGQCGHPDESRDPMEIKEHSATVPKLEFSTTYYESQSIFTPYLDSIIQEFRVTPGQMVYRGSHAAMDHSLAEGWLRYSPNKMFSFEAGHGKNFFGNGYRSLFLSDVAANYPYARIDSKFWKIHYVNLWAEFQDINYWEEYGQTYQKKYAAMHYLSLAVSKNFEINVFEAINWQGSDSEHTRNFELNYLNPIILLRPVEWTIGSPDNALLGVGFSYRVPKVGSVYGQFIIDEFSFTKIRDWQTKWSDNKVGGQIGLNTETWEVPLGERSLSVFIRSEFNAVRPYTYSHISSKTNYGHFNQSLAHPLGANFYEWVNFLCVGVDRWTIEGRYSWASFGSDTEYTNYGHNISDSYLDRTRSKGVVIGYGIQNKLIYTGLTVSYLFNPYSNFNMFASLLYRNQVSTLQHQQDLVVNIGLRSSIRNLYYDF